MIRREIRESLSASALEMLLGRGELIVEGDRDLERPRASERGYATVMLTLDLAEQAGLLRERPDVATAERVAELMRGSKVVRRQLVELARPRLAEVFAAPANRLRIELSTAVRVVGTRILVDGDAVVSLGNGGRAFGQGGR